MDAWLLRACAKLRIKLVHSQPGRPEGRWKIERFFRTVRDQFLAELTEERAARVQDLAELNKLFTAWAETAFHENARTPQASRPPSPARPVPAAQRQCQGPQPAQAIGVQHSRGALSRPLPENVGR